MGRDFFADDNAGRRAIRQLRCIARRHEFVGAFDWFQSAKAGHVGAGAIAFIPCYRCRLHGDFAGFAILDRHDGVHGNNLVVKFARRLRRRRTALAFHGKFVLRVTADAIALGHDVSGVYHLHVDGGLVFAQPFFLHVIGVQNRLHHRDRLDAPGHDGLRLTQLDRGGGHGNRLKTRCAEAVHGLRR